MNKSVISVIIPHLNEVDKLKKCIASLKAQVGDVPEFEIVVCDNGSHIVPDLSEFPDVVLVSESRPGPGPARNKAVSVAQGEILAFLDSDCWAGPNWLEVIARQFEQNADFDVIGGDVTIHIPKGRKATALEAYEAAFSFRVREMIEKQLFAFSSNMAVRAHVMAEVGPFGGIGLAEDRDWGQRASAIGFPPHFIRKLAMYHPARPDFAALAEKWDRHIAHDLFEMRKRSFWWVKWVLRAGVVAISPVIGIQRMATCPQLSTVEALRGFGMLIRVRIYRAWRMIRLAFGLSGKDVPRWNNRTHATTNRCDPRTKDST